MCLSAPPQAGSPARYGGSPSIATVGRHALERWVTDAIEAYCKRPTWEAQSLQVRELLISMWHARRKHAQRERIERKVIHADERASFQAPE